MSAFGDQARVRSRPIADIQIRRSFGAMADRKWISVWHLGCLFVGLASSIAGTLWLLVVDGIFLSDELTLTTSFGLAFLLPTVFAVVWPKKPRVQRVVGIVVGIAGSCIGIYALATLVALGHSHY